jgi:hypothetical protein
MFKRLGAALAALLIALPVLAIVSSSAASAHTKTVRRCAFDPFAGNQCWNESVPHTHPKPKPKTSTNYAPPPDTTPRDTSGNDDTSGDGSSDDDSNGDGNDGGSDDDSSSDDGSDGDSNDSGSDDDSSSDDGSDGDSNDSGSDDDSSSNDASGSGNGGPTSTTATDPCTAWAERTRNALHTPGPDGVPDITPAPSECEMKTPAVFNAVKKWLRYTAETQGEAAEGERQAQQAAYEELRRALKTAWNYELPVVQPYIDTARDYTVCTVFVAVMVKTKGKANQVPGFRQAVAGLGCTTLVEAAQTNLSGGSSGNDSKSSDSSSSSDSDSSSSSDSSDSSSDARASAPAQTPKEAWDQAMSDFVNGKLSRSGLQAAANRYQCALGVQSKC